MATFNGALLVKGNSKPEVEYTIPAWSLSMLLNLLPDGMTFLQKADGICYGSIEIDNEELKDEAQGAFGTSTIKSNKADNLFDSAFDLIIWYLTNKK